MKLIEIKSLLVLKQNALSKSVTFSALGLSTKFEFQLQLSS